LSVTTGSGLSWLAMPVSWEAALKVGSYKAVLVLAGSIIEALLVDYFLRNPDPNETDEQLLKAELGPLIARAANAKILSDTTRDLSTVVKLYRNMIHPGREVRTKTAPTKEAAVVARNLLVMIARELADVHARAAGYKADQVLQKIVRDPSIAVVEYIADSMERIERERLFKALPAFEPPSDPEDSTNGIIAVRRCLVRMHAVLKTRVPEELLTTEVGRLREVLAQGSQDDLLHMLEFFEEDLRRLDDKTVEAILKYVLDLFKSGEEAIWRVQGLCGFSFVGRYITRDRLPLLHDALRTYAWKPPPAIILAATSALTSYLEAEILGELRAWMEKPGFAFNQDMKDAVDVPF